MPELQQVLGGHAGAEVLVEFDRADRRVGDLAGHDHRDRHPRDHSFERVDDQRSVGDHGDALDGLVHEPFHRGQQRLARTSLEAREVHEVAGLIRGLLDTLEGAWQFPWIRARDHDADRVRATTLECASEVVAPVPQPLDRGLHPQPGLGTHHVRLVQHATHRDEPDAGLPGDVDHARRPRALRVGHAVPIGSFIHMPIMSCAARTRCGRSSRRGMPRPSSRP